MQLFPAHQETIISPFPARKVEEILYSRTRQITGSKPDADTGFFMFNGTVENQKFNIFLKINYIQNALPLISGSIEATKNGSIIFLKYRLFSGTSLLLWFWLFLCLFSTLFFITITKQFTYAMVSLSAGLFYYLVLMYNFNHHVKNSRQVLHQVLSGNGMH